MEVSRTQLILRRAAAFMLDQVLAVVVYWLLSLSLHGVLALQPFQQMLDLEQQTGREPYLHSMLFMLVWPLYFMAWEYFFKGRTPGKCALGLVVINAAGTPPTLIQVVIRGATRYLEAAFAFVPLMACAESSRCQRIGDMLARTYVIPHKDLQQVRSAIPEQPLSQA
ncbi:RDD family protein [Pseudomonas sp. NFXW11]|uniref:RDD family protein n=1 Tax=Pseudomonas sp. NFXW11 TaxID=2819531 RepID=UPI003CE985B4